VLSVPAASSRASRVIVFVAALAGAMLTARLGLWQLDRAAQKEAMQASLDARAGLPVVGAAELAATARGAADVVYRTVRLRGHWLPERTVYLDNRPYNDRAGFVVVTPFQWPGGAVLVQRGWVARDNNVRTRLPAVGAPPGELELTGRIAPPPPRLYEFSAAASGPIRQNLDPASYSREIGLALLPVSIQQDDASPADGLLRNWPRPAVDVYTHYGYVFQWWALCALITGLYVWHQLIRPRLARAAR
jgi:surfeit locus 1 family protein